MSDICMSRTESRNENSMQLDKMNSYQIVKLMNEEDSYIAKAIEPSLNNISLLIDELVRSFNKGGRLVYIGAGTSGRLGVLDAVECPPTFSTDYDKVIGLIAGGQGAMFKAVENSEDSERAAISDLEDIDFSNNDFLVGIAASGSTPYVLSGLKYAREIGSHTGSVSCNINAEISKYSDYPIEIDLGPEILTGSTRLKSGTATKMVLNMISTASMVGIGKVYENFMVDLMASNHKLKKRAENIVIEVAGVSRKLANEKLVECDRDVKLTIFSILTGKDIKESRLSLIKAKGFLRKALDLNRGDIYE